MGNIANRKKTIEAYMAAVQAVEEVKLKAEVLAILQKQWEDSFAAAIEAIARSKALQDTAKKAKEASQQSTQADEEVDDKEVDNKEVDNNKVDNKLGRSSDNEVSDIDEDVSWY